jgi:hypothetical protein
MQPELTQVSPNSSYQDNISNTTPPSTQHGCSVPNSTAPSTPNELQHEGSDGSSGAEQRSQGQLSGPRDTSVAPRTGGRLNTPRTPSPSRSNQKDRVSQYENAIFTPPRTNSAGPSFEVVNTTRKPGDKSSPITQLPNGANVPLSTSIPS